MNLWDSRYESLSLVGSRKACVSLRSSNWTGQGLSFPRAIYREVRGREELKRTGVYVLWSPGDSGQLPRAYVGEGDSLLERLDSHSRSKDFWTHAVAFISKDQNLNKAHVQRLETRLVGLAAEAKRCELDNANVPRLPSLSDADAADAELYLADMLLCLPIVGVNFFKKPRSQENRRQDLFLKGKGISAQGYERCGRIRCAVRLASGQGRGSFNTYLPFQSAQSTVVAWPSGGRRHSIPAGPGLCIQLTIHCLRSLARQAQQWAR